MAVMSDREAAEKVVSEIMSQMAPIIEGTNALLEKNKQLEAEVASLKNPKKEEMEQATKEEIDAVMGSLDPTYRPAPKPESEKTAHQKEIDSLLDQITPWMR